MPAATIDLLRSDQIPVAAEAMSRGFMEDPFQKFMLPDATERAERSPAHFAAMLAYGLKFGRVLTTQPVPAGAAVWLPPGQWEVTPQRAAQVGLDRLDELIGPPAAERFLSAMEHIEILHRQEMPTDHWYAMVVGIAPESQGRGIGRALLAPILNEASATGVPCFLETAQARNVPFYEHMGFHVLRSLIEPVSGLRVWIFRRDPG